MKRRALFSLAALVLAMTAGSATAQAAPMPAHSVRVVSFAERYQPTVDGMLLHRSPKPFVGLGGERGGGKTWAALAELYSLCMEFPGNRVMIFRQKFSELHTTVLPTLWRVLPPGMYEHIPSRKLIKLKGGSEMIYDGLSGDVLQSEEALKRYLDGLKSLELGGYYLNEASQTRIEFPQMLVQTLRWKCPDGRAPFYRGIYDSNPEPGWFHRLFVQGPRPRDHEYVWMRAKNNPHLPPGYFERFNFMPESWKRRYVDGLWVFAQEGDGWVYPQELVDMAFELDLAEDVSESARYGLDPAGKGADRAALTRARGPRYTVHSWEKTTGPELGWHVDDVTMRFGRAPINYDAGGLGAPNGEYLGKPRLDRDGVTTIPRHEVEAVTTKRAPLDPKKYVDYRTEMFWRLRIKMAARKASFAGESKALLRLKEQMLALRFDADKDGRPCVETKKVFKLRTGMSPDELESVIYADERPPKITVTMRGR